MDVSDRLKNVQIENRPAQEIIKRFRYPNVFIYADPPYVLGTRSGKQYKYEMSDQDHVELLNLLLDHPGPVILSGYENDLYNDMLQGWHKEKSIGYAEYYGGKEKTEVIWMNYESTQQIKMF